MWKCVWAETATSKIRDNSRKRNSRTSAAETKYNVFTFENHDFEHSIVNESFDQNKGINNIDSQSCFAPDRFCVFAHSFMLTCLISHAWRANYRFTKTCSSCNSLLLSIRMISHMRMWPVVIENSSRQHHFEILCIFANWILLHQVDSLISWGKSEVCCIWTWIEVIFEEKIEFLFSFFNFYIQNTNTLKNRPDKQ